MKVSLYLVDPRKYLPSLTPSIRSLGHFVCMEIEKCDIKMGSSDALGRIWQVNGEEGGLQLMRMLFRDVFKQFAHLSRLH